MTVFDLPASWFDDDVPEPYVISGVVSGTTRISLELAACNKVAVDGVDQGPASYATLGALVRDPSDSGGSDEPEFYLYMFEARSDNPALVGWFASLGLNATNGTVSYSNTPIAANMGEVETAVQADGAVVYRVHWFPDEREFPGTDSSRWFFGQNPDVDYLDHEGRYVRRGSGYPGEFEMSQDSRFAQALDGMLPGPPQTVAREAMSLLLLPSAARQP